MLKSGVFLWTSDWILLEAFTQLCVVTELWSSPLRAFDPLSPLRAFDPLSLTSSSTVLCVSTWLRQRVKAHCKRGEKRPLCCRHPDLWEDIACSEGCAPHIRTVWLCRDRLVCVQLQRPSPISSSCLRLKARRWMAVLGTRWSVRSWLFREASFISWFCSLAVFTVQDKFSLT